MLQVIFIQPILREVAGMPEEVVDATELHPDDTAHRELRSLRLVHGLSLWDFGLV
jgi:hypothetical protein